MEIETSKKVLKIPFFGDFMAIHPNPDRSESVMRDNFGTVCLITDVKADFYLNKAKKHKYDIPEDRLSRWCGGKDGFDDFAEWL